MNSTKPINKPNKLATKQTSNSQSLKTKLGKTQDSPVITGSKIVAQTQKRAEVPLGNVPSKHVPKGVWTTVHEGFRVGERRAGRVERRDHETGIWIRGEERLYAPSGTFVEGGLISQVTLNPQTLGPRTALLSFPYAKFKFTKVRLRFVAAAATSVSGVFYMGAYLDPDQTVPFGLGATQLWTELGANVVEFQQYADAELNVKLRLDEQDPCFIDNVGDARFGSQGTVFMGAGTAMSSSPMGQWFIEYECKLLDENMEAIPSGTVCGSSDSMVTLATGTQVFTQAPVNANSNNIVGAYSNYFGDRTILVAGDTSAGTSLVANMIFPKVGYYCLTLFYEALTVAATFPQNPILSIISGAAINQFFDYGGNNAGPHWSGAGISTTNTITNTGTTSNVTTNAVMACAFFFTVSSPGALAMLTGPTTTVGNIRSIFSLSRILSTPNPGLSTGTIRPGPVSVAADGSLQLAPSMFDTLRMLDSPPADDLDDSTKLLIMRQIITLPEEEWDRANVCIRALELPMCPFRLTTAACSHPAIGIIMWFVRNFGPVIAAKALGIAQKKIEEWTKKQK